MKAAEASDALGTLAHGQLVAGGDLDQTARRPLLLELVSGNRRQRAVGIELDASVPKHHRQRRDGAVVMDRLCQAALRFAPLPRRLANHDEGFG